MHILILNQLILNPLELPQREMSIRLKSRQVYVMNGVMDFEVIKDPVDIPTDTEVP